MVKGRYLLLVVWAIIILVLCGMPPKDVDKIAFINFPYIDKVAHILLYVGFGLSVMAVVNLNKRLKGTFLSYVLAIAICAFYGWIIEILQLEVFPGRSYELMDVVADTTGAIVGVLAYNWVSTIFVKIFKIKM